LKKATKKSKLTLSKQVYQVFLDNPAAELNYKNVSHKLKINKKSARAQVSRAITELVGKNQIKEMKPGKYKLAAKDQFATGVVDMTASGNGYVVTPELDKDIFIASKRLNTALPDDKVKVRYYKSGKKKKLEGEIVEVLERRRTQFVGTLELSDGFGFLVADTRNMPVDIFLPKLGIGKEHNGQKAIVEMLKWTAGERNPVGKLIKILGDAGTNDAEMQSIIADKGFALTFPTKVEKEAEQISTDISEKEIKSRRDFRNVTTCTIDPADAKDFDDALSYRQLDNGHYEIGVHIADVTHYITPDTMLDKEAYQRGTSIYLVDRVFPMLPEGLSNKLCSLRPNEDKLCFGAVFEMNDDAKIINEWFGKTIIHSNKRYTYENVQNILTKEESGDYDKELLKLNILAKKLKESRFREGAISFEKAEVKFNIDPDGVPLGIYLKERFDAHFLIEEFMLLANKQVATFMSKNQNGNDPFVYRVHDNPDPERLTDFKRFAERFNYKLRIDTPNQIRESLIKLLKEIQGKPEQNVLEQLAIRTMAKAIYTTKNIGHYGLGFSNYTHFTSPIRRYSDMMAHRLLEKRLNKTPTNVNRAELESSCKHVSEREADALEAERDSIKFKQAEFLLKYKNQQFEGIISGMIERGIFVEIIENKCEGMIRISDIEDDQYVYDEHGFCVKGRNSGKKFSLGDKVNIIVKEVNLAKRTIDFELVNSVSRL